MCKCSSFGSNGSDTTRTVQIIQVYHDDGRTASIFHASNERSHSSTVKNFTRMRAEAMYFDELLCNKPVFAFQEAV